MVIRRCWLSARFVLLESAAGAAYRFIAADLSTYSPRSAAAGVYRGILRGPGVGQQHFGVFAMEKVATVQDVSGRELCKGDTVSTLNGALTGRISDLAADEGTEFVRIRPMHQPYGRGDWHAADRVMYVASARRRREDASGGPTDKAAGKAKSGRSEGSPAAAPNRASKRAS